MAKKIKAVIFDWAGTTVDYGCFAPIKGFVEGFASIGIDITDEMARKPMGLMKIDHTRAIAAMLPEPIAEEQILQAYEVFEKTLFSNIEHHCDVKDHVAKIVGLWASSWARRNSGFPEMKSPPCPKTTKTN